MKGPTIIIMVAIAIAAVIIATGITKDEVKMTNVGKTSLATISTGSTETGDVSIDATPLGVKDRKLTINIAANTHSVELSQFNLKEIITLEYDGKSLKPESAPVLTGHHSSGMLVFDVSKDINSFRMRIKGIPKQEMRVFEW